MDPGTKSVESVIKHMAIHMEKKKKKEQTTTQKKRKGFWARNPALAFLSCMLSAPPSLCSTALPALRLGCYKFTCKFHKMLYCYQLY